MENLKFFNAAKIEEFIYKNRIPLIIFLFGLLVLSLGAFLLKGPYVSNEKVEVLEGTTESQNNDFYIVEVSGQVISPGVYKLSKVSRVEDLLVAAGGLTIDADRNWIEKTLNRAAKLTDGQKIYIPKVEEQIKGVKSGNSNIYQSGSSGQGSGLVNINSASQSELESLNGIGPVYAQKIIEQRPYSNIDELSSKGVIPKSTFEKIKNEISIF